VKIFTFILAVLFLATPMQAHIDVVAYDDVDTHEHYHENELDHVHQQEHHNHDSENDKKSDHHHHCVDVNVSFAYIPSVVNFNFITISNTNEIIDFYTRKHSSKDLESLFQPPRFA